MLAFVVLFLLFLSDICFRPWEKVVVSTHGCDRVQIIVLKIFRKRSSHFLELPNKIYLILRHSTVNLNWTNTDIGYILIVFQSHLWQNVSGLTFRKQYLELLFDGKFSEILKV